ncbi:hypothetical protein D3C85_1144410 [compost metagenome]
MPLILQAHLLQLMIDWETELLQITEPFFLYRNTQQMKLFCQRAEVIGVMVGNGETCMSLHGNLIMLW